MKLILDSNFNRLVNQNNFNFKTWAACGVSKTRNTAFFTYSRLVGFFKEVEDEVLQNIFFRLSSRK